MKIQSLSISVPVPTKKGGCINNCPFCCSNSHREIRYENNCLQNGNIISIRDYTDRLIVSKEKGVDTLILTGEIEPLQNKDFVFEFLKLNRNLNSPFRNIELQTTGVFLNYDMLYDLRVEGVTTISLSISNLFDDVSNMSVIGTPNKLKFNLDVLCSKIKNLGFNLRLSINMLKYLDSYKPEEVINRCKELGANQITFRKMWRTFDGSKEDNWVSTNCCSDDVVESYNNWILKNGRKLHRLTNGAFVYTILGMSTIVDMDCMDDKNEKYDEQVIRYLILRENGRLYTHWDDEGSLWF